MSKIEGLSIEPLRGDDEGLEHMAHASSERGQLGLRDIQPRDLARRDPRRLRDPGLTAEDKPAVVRYNGGMILHLVVTILAAVFSVGTIVAQGPAIIEPGSVYQWHGLTVVSPDEPGWALAKSDGTQIVFERRSDRAILRASVSIIKTNVYRTDEDLLASLEPLKQEEWRAMKVDHLHFDRKAAKGGPFLQYDGIFNIDDPASPGFSYLNLRGRLYPRPQAKGLVVQAEFSDRSNMRGFSEDRLSLADEFFAKIVFPSPPPSLFDSLLSN